MRCSEIGPDRIGIALHASHGLVAPKSDEGGPGLPRLRDWVVRRKKMIDTRAIVPDRMLRQEGLSASPSSVDYPGAFETWTLVRSASKEVLGYLSFHPTAGGDGVVIKFCRFLPDLSGSESRCYSLPVTRKGTGIRALLRRVLISREDPYLDPKVVDPAPEIYRDDPKT